MNEFFPGQKADEKVMVVARPHWLVLLPTILVSLVLAAVPIIVLIAIPAANFEITGLGEAITTVLVSVFYLMLLTWFFIRWLDFYLDVAIVTSDRIVDIDQNGLFKRAIDELDSKMIQDVTASKHGILQTLFNFGDVEIQTAGERRNFTFTGVPNPDHIQKLVAQSQGMGESEAQESSAQKNAREAAEKAKAAAEAAKRTTEAQATAAKAGAQASPGPTPPASSTPKDPQSKLDSQDLPREFE